MAGHPLRSATDRRLGGLLSHQLANQTRVHLIPPEFFTPCHATLCAYAVLPAVSSCYPPVQGRLPTRYSPVRHSVISNFIPKKSVANASFDLHVLSTPPAFILSQDQTLVKSVCIQFRINILANSSLFTVVWFLTVRSTASSSKLLLCSCSLRFLKIFLLKKFSRVIVVYCSIIKVLFTV